MRIIIILSLFLLAAGCDTMTEKKVEAPVTERKMPDDEIHKQTAGGDEKAGELSKEADDAYSKYVSSKSEEDKEAAIKKGLAAGMYLMYDAQLPPKDKYAPALKHFRRVLEMDPSNKEAKDNKKTIEDIYTSMGKPIPQ